MALAGQGWTQRVIPVLGKVVPASAAARRRTGVVGGVLLLGWLSGLGAHTPGIGAGTTGASAAAAANPPSTAGPPARHGGISAGPASGPASRAARRPPAGAPAPPSAGSAARSLPPLLAAGIAPPLTVPRGRGVPSAPAAPPRVDCRTAKCVALTFDDGPGRDTARLLGMLAARHARATFFLIGGNIRGREAIVRRELAEGHAIGDHTWTHADLSGLSGGAVRWQLTRTLAEMRRATGTGTALMRPPYGSTNHRVAVQVRRLGMAQILWSVDTNDWRDRNARIVAHRAITWAHRNDIILMHDIHPTTVAAVPAILDGLARRGFTFVTVPELFGARRLRPGHVYFDGPAVPVRKSHPHRPRATAAPTGDTAGAR